jgi:hypothetical protein
MTRETGGSDFAEVISFDTITTATLSYWLEPSSLAGSRTRDYAKLETLIQAGTSEFASELLSGHASF